MARTTDSIPKLQRNVSEPIASQSLPLGASGLWEPREPETTNEFRSLNESPRQVAAGVFLLLGLLGLVRNQTFIDERPGAAFRQAMWSVLLFIMTYCGLNTRDGVMKQPHPGLWRLLHGWNLWYGMLVAVFLVVPNSDGTVLMSWVFPDVIRTPKEALTLGTDHLACEITWTNVERQLTGIWFFAHAVGWWAKMVMLRDLKVCLVYSTVFEFCELTLQFLVPEFQECWWDSMIMDWLLANCMIGMMLGKVTLVLLKMKSFDWYPKHKMLHVFSPSRWGEFHWNPANDPITMVLNSAIWIIMAVGEVNSFFFINILQLPRDHPFNMLRQALLCLTALPAVEEWYEYTRHVRAEYTTKYTYGREWGEYKKLYMGRKPRIGHFTWLLTVTIALETMAIIKYSPGHVRLVAPGPEIWVPWALFAVLFSVYFSVHCWFFYSRERSYPIWLCVLGWGSAAPLFLLCRLYAF